MSYPGPKVHRPSRRKLGRNQYPTSQGINVSAVASGSTAVLTFDRPVVIKGPIPMTIATLTFVSQAVNSPTQATLTFSAAVAAHTWSIPAGAANVASATGGQIIGQSGTF